MVDLGNFGPLYDIKMKFDECGVKILITYEYMGYKSKYDFDCDYKGNSNYLDEELFFKCLKYGEKYCLRLMTTHPKCVDDEVLIKINKNSVSLSI